MLYKLSRFIDQAAQDVPPLLWSRAAVQRMKSVVERFPDIRSRTIGPARLGIMGLELRLASEDEQVDLTFPILKEDRDVIVALGEAEEDGRWLREEPVWRRILEFCRKWSDPETLISRYVKLLWLELDVTGDTGAGSLPAPGIFVRFEPEASTEESFETWRRLLHEVLTALTGQAPSPELTARFQKGFDSLPAHTFVQYVGLMLSRGSETLRFVFADFDEQDLPDFLEILGWPGQPSELRKHLAQIVTSPGGERLHRGAGAVQVDIGQHGVLPRIGLEYVFDRARQVEEGIAEQAFLSHLADSSTERPPLIAREKLEALQTLPGRFIEPWRGLCMLGHSRQVHHVKVVLSPDGPKEAKAYYGRALAIRPLEASEKTQAKAAGLFTEPVNS